MILRVLTLSWNSIAGDRLLHHLQHLDGLCRRCNLVFVVVQDVQAPGPISFETRVANDNSNIRTFTGCEQHCCRREADYKSFESARHSKSEALETYTLTVNRMPTRATIKCVEVLMQCLN